MSAQPIDAGGIFRVGGVLRRAWRLLAGNIPLFLAVPVITYTAIAVARGYAFALIPRAFPDLNIETQAEWALAVIIFVAVIVPLGLNMIGQAVILLAVLPRLRGQPFRAAEVLQNAMARAYPLLGLVLLWSVAPVWAANSASLETSSQAARPNGVCACVGFISLGNKSGPVAIAPVSTSA